MAIYSRRPKLKSSRTRGTKLYKTDDEFLESLLESKEYRTASDAIADLVNEAIRIRRAKDLGRDETMYAVVKKQEQVVHNGTQHLVTKLDEIGHNIQEELGHHSLTITDLAERVAMVERQAARTNTALNRVLEILVVCYGILRHYVLGIFVLRLTKTKFDAYSEGFKKRLDLFRTSIRAGNLLLEGDYEKHAEEFAQGLEDATTIKMPLSNEDQEAAQKLQPPVLTSAPFGVPDSFPKD